MRILYLSLSYIPSRRASSVQVMKTCAAFARRGHEVILVAKQGPADGTDDHARYRVEPSFEIVKISRPPWRGGGVAYAAGMARQVIARRGWADVVYCRDPIGAALATELRMPTVFEAHEVPSAPWLRRLLAHALRRSLGTVAISDALRRDLIAGGLHPAPRPIVVAHDACDPPRRAAAPRACFAPPTVGYVGSLYPGRGIEKIVALAAEMPAVQFRVVGGSEDDLAHWRARAVSPNLELLGFRPQGELPALYETFDVVVMPHSTTGVLGASKSADISRWTSPMKMFEYMASGVPLIASNLPVLREVLRDGENALVVDDDLGAWRGAIDRLLADDALRARLALAAQRDLERSYTWDARAATVLSGLGLEAIS